MKQITCICSNVISPPERSYGWQKCICGIKIHYGREGYREFYFSKDFNKYTIYFYLDETTLFIHNKESFKIEILSQDVNFLLREDITDEKLDKLMILK